MILGNKQKKINVKKKKRNYRYEYYMVASVSFQNTPLHMHELHGYIKFPKIHKLTGWLDCAYQEFYLLCVCVFTFKVARGWIQ